MFVAAAAGVLLSAGCEKKEPRAPDGESERTDEAAAEPPPAVPEFGWERAANSAPTDVETAVGPFESECRPDESLRDLDSRGVDELFDSPAGCQLAAPEDDQPAKYRVRRILYSGGQPAAIELRPGRQLELPMAAEGLEELDLPHLEVVRSYSAGVEEGPRPVRAFRRERIDAGAGAGTLLGVDLVGSERQQRSSVAERAVLYLQTGDDTGRRLAQWRGPPAADERLMLPAAIDPTAEHADVAVEIRLEEVRMRRWDDYPVRRPASEVVPAELRFSRDALGGENQGDESTWETNVEEFVASIPTDGDGAGNERPDIPRATFGIAATRTTPVGELGALSGVLEGAARGSMQLVVRSAERVGPGFDPFPSRGALRFERSSGPPEATSRTGESFLNLRVEAGVEGFEIVAGGEPLPPIPGCRDPGPTVCVANPEVDLREQVDRSASLQRTGELREAHAALSEALDRFDWAALHRNLRRIHDRYSDASRIYLTADPGLPVAVLVRTMDVARFRLRPTGVEDCSGAFSDNDELSGAVPCERDDGEPRTMFDRPRWVSN